MVGAIMQFLPMMLFLDLMRKYLNDDYIVGTIAYGKFAVDYIREYPTDLVIMDIMMPERCCLHSIIMLQTGVLIIDIILKMEE